jgi:hypothetical protein
MPHTLSDAETSLLLHHLLGHQTDPALVPIIQSLHSSLRTSRTASPYSPTNPQAGELFHDFLGSGEFPGNLNDWDPLSLSDSDLSLPNPSLPNPSLLNPSLLNPSFPNLSLSDSDLSLPNPLFLNPSDLLDDRHSYYVNDATFERRSDALSDPISSCNYGDPAVMSLTNDYGISKDNIHEVRNTFVMLI